MIYYMDKIPRLELAEEKSNLKNNDYIIFRNVSKGKTGRVERVKKTRRVNRVKKVKRGKRTEKFKRVKKFFGLF